MESQYKRRKSSLLLLIIFIFLFILCNKATTEKSNKMVKITIKASPISIYQEEEMPQYKASIVCEGNQEVVLDNITKYKVEDLIKDLTEGKRYTITSKADGNIEGETSTKTVLSEELLTKLHKTWLGKVRITMKEADVVVKNKYGEWDGDKFIRRDGSNVVSDWIISKAKVYFFDENGMKAKGWKDGNRRTSHGK